MRACTRAGRGAKEETEGGKESLAAFASASRMRLAQTEARAISMLQSMSWAALAMRLIMAEVSFNTVIGARTVTDTTLIGIKNLLNLW